MRSLTCLLLVPLLSLASLACDSDPSAPPDSGTVVLATDGGVDFATGLVHSPGTYVNSDLYASPNGESGMKLTTGGPTIIVNRPVSWFKTGGGIATEFPDLASVPVTPLPTTVDAMLHAKTSLGFLLETAAGDHVRGWIASATSSSVTIQWERVAE